jgi:hypothetical protein
MVTHDRIRLTACYREAPLSSWRRGFSTYGARSTSAAGSPGGRRSLAKAAETAQESPRGL